MPNIGALPAIGPSQEQTISIDFGNFLPSGVTLTGTPIVVLSAAPFGSDPNPSSRITRAPIVGTVTVADGGTGITNAAVLFQVGGCILNTTYTVDIVCDRSDSDVAEASTWFDCQ